MNNLIIRIFSFLGLLLSLSCNPKTTGLIPSASKPNLIIIQTDEHNFRTLGCYRQQLKEDQAYVWGENNQVETPNIDFLANNGALFTKFYAATPLCTPSRGSLISGLYPQNIGTSTNDSPLNDDVTTFAMTLQENGYKTAFFGKWHLDGTGKPQWAPKRKFGFEDNRYMFNRGHWKKMEDTPNGPRIAATDTTGLPTYDLDNADERSFTTDFLVDKGIEFIQNNKNHPFGIYLSIPDPHGPDQVRPPYDTMYQHMKFKAPITYYKSREGVPSWADHSKQASTNQATYFGMVKCIDDNVGKIISYLKKNDLFDKTIIVFTSDHGDLRGEHHRDNKGIPLEASAKIPFIVYYPNKIPANTIVNKAFNTVDFSPTILSFMGQNIPEAMQGRNFSTLLLNPNHQDEWEDITFMRSGNRDPKNQWVASVTSRYKLVLSSKDDPWLIDMQTDPNELTNYIGQAENGPIVKTMARQLKEYGLVHKDPFLKDTKIAEDIEKLLLTPKN